MADFKERLNALLMDSQLSIKDFAAKVLGVTRQSAGYYLNGNRIPDIETLARICKNTGVSADWLLGLSEVKSTEADFQTACETFGFSEKTGKALLSCKSHALDSFLSLDCIGVMIEYYWNYVQCKEYATTEKAGKLDIFPNGTVRIDCRAAAALYAHRAASVFENYLTSDSEKEDFYNGKS